MSKEWNGAEYDRLSGPQARWGLAVLDRMTLNGDETVLDAGCGSGRVTEALLERLPRGRVVAVDGSTSMLEEAGRRLEAYAARCRFVRADLLELGPEDLGADAPVDAVLSTATFHWVTDHDRLFSALAGVMRPGAQLVAQCGGKGNIDNVIRAVRSLGVERAGTWLYASADETAERLERAGFTDVHTWTHPEPTPFEPGAPLVDFLETVCLREHLAQLPETARRPFAARVADEMGAPVIDYVRLNLVARRAEH
ncbi:MAG: class I SAM-dependent methyltransferase [Acidimicrobiales bacterium]